MSFGFPASSTSSRRFDLGQQELACVVSEALRNLGWPYVTPYPNEFLARISTNLWSWGEQMSVDIIYDGTVQAKSECLLATQCLDWGKNSRNLKAFFAEVARLASSYAPSQLPVAAYDQSAMTPLERIIKGEKQWCSC
jgi:hypothetical protein